MRASGIKSQKKHIRLIHERAYTAYFSIFFQYSLSWFPFSLLKPYSSLARKLTTCKYVMELEWNWNPKDLILDTCVIQWKPGQNSWEHSLGLIEGECINMTKLISTLLTDDSSVNWSESHINWSVQSEGLYSSIHPLGIGLESWPIICVASRSFRPSAIWTIMYLYKGSGITSPYPMSSKWWTLPVHFTSFSAHLRVMCPCSCNIVIYITIITKIISQKCTIPLNSKFQTFGKHIKAMPLACRP